MGELIVKIKRAPRYEFIDQLSKKEYDTLTIKDKKEIKIEALANQIIIYELKNEKEKKNVLIRILLTL